MNRGARIALIVTMGVVGVSIAAWAGYERRWGSEVDLETWGDLEAHVFGEGSTCIVVLHGYRGSPDRVHPLAQRLAETVPARYVLPRGGHRVDGGGWAWFRWPDEVGGQSAHRQSVLAARRSLLALVERARSEGAERVVLIGHSMGARVAGDVALALETPPEALGLLAGSTLPSWDVDHLADLPIFIGHGAADQVFPLDHAIEVRDALIEHGARVTWYQHEGSHHYRLAVDELALFLSTL